MRKAYFNGYTIYEDGKIIGLQGREIKKRINNGRYEVRMSIDGERKNFLVARLMYYVFHGFDIDNKDLCVVFKDDNRLNIHLDNLELKHRRDIIHGENHKSVAKLTNKQVEEIRQLYNGKAGVNQHDKEGYSQSDLAKMYGVTKSAIWSIINESSRNESTYKLSLSG